MGWFSWAGTVEGQRSGVNTSGYGEPHKIVVSDALGAGGVEKPRVRQHVAVNARQSKGAVPWEKPLYGGAIPDTPLLEIRHLTWGWGGGSCLLV